MGDDLAKAIFGGQMDSASLTSRLRRIERSGVYLRRGVRIDPEDGYSVVTAGAVSESAEIYTPGSDVLKSGSVPPSTSTSGFAATSVSGAGAGTSNLHIYWDGTNSSTRIIIDRTDSTRFVVPAGDLNITGLNPSTTYYFLPFWPLLSGCSVGFVQGTVGSPLIAFTVNTDAVALAKQVRQDREQLSSGYMSFVTAAASGSSGGTGAGGGGAAGKCVLSGTDIKPLGNGMLSIEVLPWREWVRIETEHYSLTAVPEHPIYAEHCGKIQMQHVEKGHAIITDLGIEQVVSTDRFHRLCTKHCVHLSEGHLYWANGILSHNVKEAT